MPNSIFETCSKCNQTILKSESKSHKCKPQVRIRYKPNSNMPDSVFSTLNSIYSELAKMISYRIMPNCDHEILVKALKQLTEDVTTNKDRTIDEEAFKILESVGKPLTAQAITQQINSTYGFPVRKVDDVRVAMSGNRKVFESDKYSTTWYLKNWEVQA
ncbi:MAG: winged helix-turn-helix domain-containing protein [Nitrosarchaeum sp.]|nr:winged helix-turn-helix domain-containing protein [Nitrosarchaeum sp.]